jgi:APA family basic amino acid/polyamine antiporter
VREGVARERRLGLTTTTALVVASMVGTGVFTTTGLLTADIPSAGGIVLCWLVAGVASLCGALAYAELGVAFAESGGEYYFLSRLMHPVVGFVSAFVSLVVGFAAPLAAIALAFGEYFRVFVDVDPRVSGATLVVALSALNVWRVSAGAGFQNAFTIGKVLLIAAFIAVGLGRGDLSRLGGGAPLMDVVATPGFAIGLLWVAFAYTGWNAGVYVAGEVRDPHRTLPRALVLGTLLVTLLYVALNAVFLSSAPLDALAGNKVGHEASRHLFGEGGARVMSALIALGLVSTVGAVCVTGPRIYEAVGRDLRPLRFLAHRRPGGGPIYAVLTQMGLALAMMLSADFDDLLMYTGFTLSIFAALAVGSVFLLRRRRDIPTPYKMWGYPWTPLAYVALMLWMIAAGIIERPITAAYGLGTLALGGVLYLITKRA